MFQSGCVYDVKYRDLTASLPAEAFINSIIKYLKEI